MTPQTGDNRPRSGNEPMQEDGCGSTSKSGGKAPSPRRTRFILVLVIGFMVVCGIALFLQNDSRAFRSPNGNIVRLERWDFQAGRIQCDLPNRFLATLCARVLPDSANQKFKWLRPARTCFVGPAEFPGEPFLSAAFSAKTARMREWSASGTGTRMIVLDDSGQSYDGGVNDQMGSVFSVQAFPRRGRYLRLRLVGYDGKTVAEFKVRNPCRGPHPLWKADALPLAASRGALEITLEKFTADAGTLRTECVFRVRENGQDSAGWLPDSFEISDATGNHWRPALKPPAPEPNGRVRVWFRGALWPGENAWKLRVLFKPANMDSNTRAPAVFEFLAKPEQVGMFKEIQQDVMSKVGSAGMKWLLQTYSSRFNRRHSVFWARV